VPQVVIETHIHPIGGGTVDQAQIDAAVGAALAAREVAPTAVRTRIVSEDITDRLAADLALIEAEGGGELALRPGRYTWSRPLRYNHSRGRLELLAGAAELKYVGADPVGLTLYTDVKQNTGRCAIRGGDWVGAGDKTAVASIDAQGNIFDGPRFSGFRTAIELRNEIRWSENTKIYGVGVTGRHAVVFSPQSVTGGDGGSESYAGTRIRDLWVGGGAAGEPKIWLRGAVYGSVIGSIRGNVPSGSEVIRVGAGWYRGTTCEGSHDIETIDGGPGGACLYRNDGYGGSEITNTAKVNLRNMVEHHPQFPVKFAPHFFAGVLDLPELDKDPIAPNAGRVKVFARGGRVYRRSTGGVAEL